jgi:uncharacterized protein (TIGR00156 family)
MKTRSILILGAVFFSLSLIVSYAQEGFTGPGGASGGYTGPGALAQLTPATVSEAKKLRDNTPVALRGKIVRAVRKEKYEFSDDSGTIIVEIDREVWRGISVDENTPVEIRGHVDREAFGVKIDVKSVSVL